jgi:hypothetical protein
MHHHGGVNAIKSASLELENLAAGVAHSWYDNEVG